MTTASLTHLPLLDPAFISHPPYPQNDTTSPNGNMVYFFGTALYVGLLLTNAIAILSEERFLAKSTFPLIPFPSTFVFPTSSPLLCSSQSPINLLVHES
jgi:hypothetical protein